MALRFDLQSHSTHSDGALPAAEVVQRAAAAGVELLALSDHDTISGVAEAIEAGERYGVKIVPAVEISAVDAGS
ncbi:MAG TPA: PHP domain-containing protein, partial [Solirubrobacteraceae bacterium]|nr:PHP domain-containing protein [Solirubrobacteraceae bacterium]